MPPAPVPLSPSRQAAYDELYDLFGKAEADQYALSSSQFEQAVTPPPAPPVATIPAPAPRIAAPVSGQIITGPSGRPQFVPVGMEPAPTPVPEPREQLLTRPALPELRIDQEKVAATAIELRAAQAMKRGVPREEAYREAQQYVEKARETPRTMEYGAPKAPPGYSELAVRGEELLPKMGRGEVVMEAIKPQVLETAEQAEGRRRFERAKNDAKALLEQRAKAAGISIKDQADREAIGNAVRAGELARAQFGDDATMDQIREIQAALNAPLYAAVEEFRGVPPGEVLSRFAADTLRGLTQEERFGRLVETPAARSLRVLGGATRLGTEALRTPVEYVTSEIAARTSGVPGVTGAQLRAEREAEIAAAGPQRAITPGVTYEPGFEERQRLETGSYVKDVAYQVATGRSAIDDWYDAGVGARGASVLGLITEIGLPMTPVGYITDVPKALGAGRALAKVAEATGDVIKAPRLNRFIKETGKSMSDLGFAMQRPSFWEIMTRATDARVSTARQVAEEMGDVAAFERALKSSDKDAIVKAIADANSSTEPSVFSNRIIDRLTREGVDVTDRAAIIRSNIIQDEIGRIQRTLGSAGKVAADAVQPDILRNTYAAALKDTNRVGELSERAVRSAVAETLEKVPDSGWSFVTPRLAVKKTTIAKPEFQKAVGDAVRDATRANPNITVDEVQRVVENTITREFRGTQEALAQPVAVAPPRPPRLLPEAPRGGLERIAAPEARRLPVIEIGQDIADTGRVIAREAVEIFSRNPTKRISDTFSGSKFVGSLKGTLSDAMSARIPVEIRDFIAKTSSEINSLGSTIGTATEKGGPIINALRVQGGLEDYLDARIFADVTDPDSLSALRMDAPYEPGGAKPRLQAMNDTQKSVVAEEVEKIVRNFFGDEAVAEIIDPNFASRLAKASQSAVDTSNTTLDAVSSTIASMRSEFPVLVGRGRVVAGADDVSGAVLNHIVNSEARVIFSKNIETLLPEVSPITADTIIERFRVQAASYNMLPQDADFIANDLKSIFSDDTLRKEFERQMMNLVRRQRRQATTEIIPSSQAYNRSLADKVLADSGVPDDLLSRMSSIDPVAPSAFLDALVIDDEIQAAAGWASQNRLIRQVNESDALQWVSDSLRLPITSTERKVIESLIGPIDDLAKGSGRIADNLKGIYRSPKNGLGFSFSDMFSAVANAARSASRSGLTVGTLLPNIKFHSTNYITAPFIIGLTSPGLAWRATVGEISRVTGVKLGDFIETNARHVTAAAAKNPDGIAFVSTNGIPYTNKQLSDFMSQNYFGMTQSVNDFGNQFANDVRIAIGTGPSGKVSSIWQKGKDRALQFWNINGTNYSTNFASFVDTQWRQNVFLAALKAGETPDAARSLATNAVLDYGRIPGEMRTAAARYMTFFSWFAVSNAEAFSALFRPKAFEAVARTAQAQRTLHRGWGEWDYADDAFKNRIFSIEVGDYDDLPAFFVGPSNPSLDPLINQASIIPGLAVALASGNNPGDALSQGFKGIATSIVEQSFTPELAYLKDIGVIGEKRKGLVVPWRQVAVHQAMGPEHFAAWMSDNGVTPIPLDRRRLGEPTFYGQQYQYKDDAARDRASLMDFALMMVGLGRAYNDYAAMGVIAAPATGIDLKRFDNTSLGLLQYFSGGNLQKGTTEYEQVRKAIEQTNRELREMSKEK